MARALAGGRFRFEQWSRGHSPLHRLPPAAKLAVVLLLLLTISLWSRAWLLFPLALVLTLVARLPLAGLLARVAVILPFTLGFAALAAWAGDPQRALLLVWRSTLSAWWVLLLVSTTPLEHLLSAARRFGLPPLVAEVMHFTWRYFGVAGEQATRMRTAALARGGERSFEISAASLASLFAGSYARAERIHRAMLARGGGPAA